MALKIPKYQATKWRGVADNRTKEALEDLSVKVEMLARDVSPGLVFMNGIIMTFEKCPPGWELVAEMDGRVPLGVLDPLDAGAAGGSMTHNHGINSQAGTNTGSTAIDAHTHTIGDDGAHVHTITADASHTHPTTATSTSKDMEAVGVDTSVTYINTIGVNTGAGSSHNHGGNTSSDGTHNHGAVTGGTSGTGHTHTIPSHNHGGNTQDTDATPAHVKIVFCRRIREEAR